MAIIVKSAIKINKGFDTWVLVVSKLPNDEFYFNCAGKIW